MKDSSESRTHTIADVIVLGIVCGTFFFDITGVLGLRFAIIGVLIAIGLAVALCWKRPAEDQA